MGQDKVELMLLEQRLVLEEVGQDKVELMVLEQRLVLEEEVHGASLNR